MTEAVLRNLTLLLPLVAVAGAAGLRARRGDLAAAVPGAVLASLLAWVGMLALETAGSWWSFAPGPSTVLGMPLETSLGWALAWGALPVLAGGPPPVWWLGFLWLDLLLVPRLEPLVTLGPSWVVGEVVLLAVVAAPALALGRMTSTRSHLRLRVLGQAVTFAALFGWAAPTLAMAADGRGWADVVDHGWPVRSGLVALAVVVGVPVASAVTEMARVGGGTPFPWDPPERLVVTGPYAYLSNPMQAGAAALLALLALAAGSATVLLGVAFAVVFSLAVADPHERAVLDARWPTYPHYRREVRGWVPRWRPVVTEPATLWVAQSCPLCRGTAAAVDGLGATGLVQRPAEESPVRLTRMRWSSAGVHDRGVAALARALEHTTLPWAWLGWIVRLPVLVLLVQAVADACGLGPRDLAATRVQVTS